MEIWKDVPGYEGYYQISNTGKIKSLDRIVRGEGRKPYVKAGRVLKLAVASHGYLSVPLCKDSGQVTHSLHYVLAQVFIENPNNYPCVNHKDGNKLNNDLQNLEWVTYQQNSKHAYDTGLRQPYRKITTQQVNEIRALGKYLKLRPCQLAPMYDANQSSISEILNYKLRLNG